MKPGDVTEVKKAGVIARRVRNEVRRLPPKKRIEKLQELTGAVDNLREVARNLLDEAEALAGSAEVLMADIVRTYIEPIEEEIARLAENQKKEKIS
jgi:hypothetical protein